MNIKASILILIFYSSSIFADNLTVYRWVDKNNVVHFSQHQPAHDDYVEMTIAGNNKTRKVSSDKSPPPAVDNPPKPNTEKEEITQESSSDDKLCQTAKDNLKTLKEFGNIQYKDAEGNIKILTEREKQQQITMNTTQVEVYCIN